jgi:CheY-like chemotaxis protein
MSDSARMLAHFGRWRGNRENENFTTLSRARQLRPRLVLAHHDPVYATSVSRAFRMMGWDACLALTGPAARRLVRKLRADLVVLATNLPGESGWLTCAKLIEERPRTRVVLVSDDLDEADLEFARFVGAAGIYAISAGAAPLLDEARRGRPSPKTLGPCHTQLRETILD